MAIVEDKQGELLQLLKDIAKPELTESEIKNAIDVLRAIYTSNEGEKKFRHRYAEFFQLVVDASASNSEYNIEFAALHLSEIRESLDDTDEELCDGILKLEDHLNLEIGRNRYYTSLYSRSEDAEKRLIEQSQEINKLRQDLSTVKNELQTAREQLQKSQTDIIAVLSIFSAVVLAFSGGFSLIANVFSGLTDTPFFKAMFFVALCGFVLFNLICLLMYFVGKITGRNIYAKCKTENCSCGDGGKPECRAIKRIRNRLPYVYWVNIATLVIMVIALLCWVVQCVIIF